MRGLSRRRALQLAQRREEIEAPGLGSEFARGSVTAACPVPARGGQRLMTPRCPDLDHRLGEAVDRGIFGEEAVEHRAEQEDAVALEGLLVERAR